jgi:hypothetical protein
MAGPAYYSAQVNIAKNEDWIVAFVYQTDDGAGTITPIDLTGCLLMMEIRKHEADHEAIVSVDSDDNGITITNATGGAFTILIDRARLTRLSTGDYFTDLVRQIPANEIVERIFEGTATVVEGTSRKAPPLVSTAR